MKYLIFISVASLILACKKENNNVWVNYTMTQCADPWQNSTYFSGDKEGALKKYLEEKKIEVIELNIKLDTLCAKANVCLACTCTSCLVASVLIHESDLAAIEKLKFKRK